MKARKKIKRRKMRKKSSTPCLTAGPQIGLDEDSSFISSS
jgi:hypothetical protein